MSLVGAGIGASKALEDLVAERLLREKLEQEVADRQARLALDQRRQTEVERGNLVEEQLRGRQRDLDEYTAQVSADKADEQRRAFDNVAGLSQMGLEREPAMREAGITLGRAGVPNASQFAERMFPEPPPAQDKPKPIQYTYTNPKTGRKAIRLADPESIGPEGVDLGREPQTGGGSSEQVWVIRNGVKTPIPKGTARPGDAPYDPVLNRQVEKTQRIHPQLLKYSENVIRQVDDLIGRDDDPTTSENEAKPNRINNSTAGVGGAVMRHMPWNTEAKNVEAEMFSLASQLAIDSLQKMRASSETGGAVGNVALGEMRIMENAQAALARDQSPANLIKQLRIIRSSQQTFRDAVVQDAREQGIDLSKVSSSNAPTVDEARIQRLLQAITPPPKP